MFLEDDQLPDYIERGARGGPKFKTTIKILFSGHEKRFIDWQDVRSEWDIGYSIAFMEPGPQATNALQAVVNQFYVAQGQANGFRFKDWLDYRITDGLIGTGDAATTVFQTVKVYQTLSGSYSRVISKPVPGTYQVFVDSVLQAEPGDYSMDTTTGKVTFVTAPASSLPITITTEFDVPVRFDTDLLELSAEAADEDAEAATIPRIPIIELKPE